MMTKLISTSNLQEKMEAALKKAEKNLLVKLDRRIEIEASRAMREAWSAEISEMAARLVHERLDVLGLREVILERLASALTIELVAESIQSIIASHKFTGLHLSFLHEIENAVEAHVRQLVDSDATSIAV